MGFHNHVRRWTVLANPKARRTAGEPFFAIAFAGLVYIAVASTTNSASAVTAEVAKRCSVLTAKMYPPRVPGNPAAGSAKGTGQERQTFFQRCLANGGHVGDDDTRK
jgi:hypothetical protein